MIGLPFSEITEKLLPVPDDKDSDFPVDSFDLMATLGEPAANYLVKYYGKGYDFGTELRRMRHEVFNRLSFDQLCKVKYSYQSPYVEEIEKKFLETSPCHMIFMRIFSSFKLMEFQKAKWNDLVSFYDGLTRFTVEVPNFTVYLDFLMHWNPWGHSRYSDIFLDGVFAYNVHYKGEHVMTISFTPISNRRILIRQIQMTKPKGNRFLYKLPMNLTEFIIERFMLAFPDHQLLIADARDLAKQSLERYQSSWNRYQMLLDTYEHPSADDDEVAVETYRGYQLRTEEKMTALQNDIPRLLTVYGNTGKFLTENSIRIRDLKHYPLLT